MKGEPVCARQAQLALESDLGELSLRLALHRLADPGHPRQRRQGLRDRALIAVMLFSLARVSAVVIMRVQDFYRNGRRHRFRSKEKGGKRHKVPVHHKAEDYLLEDLAATGSVSPPPARFQGPSTTGR